jgi:hypothetical protein
MIFSRHSGAERSEEPGIHDSDWCRRFFGPIPLDLWLWIPDLPLRGNPE